MTINQNAYPALLLNADFRPVSLYPLKALRWEKAVKSVFRDRVAVVEEYGRVLRCPGSARRPPFEINLPSVVALKAYQRLDRPAAFTRAGVFLRDRNRCAYCGERFPVRDLTFDHVTPQSRGGRTVWENVVAACGPCNLRKGNKSVRQAGLVLLQEPYAPTRYQLNLIVAESRPDTSRMPLAWLDYLGIGAQPGAAPASAASGGSELAFPSGLSSNFTDQDDWAKSEGSAFSYWNVPLEE
jgi:5-methylcytosine-specific restriction endonuclease McrA